MKHLFKTILLLTAAAMGSACRTVPVPAPDERPVKVTFSILGPDGGTRLTTDNPQQESAVLHWALLLFRDGGLVDFGTSRSAGSITRELVAGRYTACAVVNYPEDTFHPETVRTVQELEGTVTDLGDNALPGLVMTGQRNLLIPEETGTGVQTIPVDRLVFKAGIRKITVRMEDPLLAARPFVLRAVYLTNCPRKSRYGSDASLPDLSGELSWANRMGHQADPSVDRLLSDTGIDAAIPADASHPVPHFFYGYPNPVGADGDSRSRAAWSPRSTRIVIEASVGGRTCYYPVTLPATARNRTYIAEEAVIRGLGSPDPEEDIPGVIEIVFSASTEEWGPVYPINEQS